MNIIYEKFKMTLSWKPPTEFTNRITHPIAKSNWNFLTNGFIYILLLPGSFISFCLSPSHFVFLSLARSSIRTSWINSFAVCVTHFRAREKYLYFICILGAQRGNKKWLEEGFHNIFRWKYMILHASGLEFRVYVIHSCWDLYARHKVTRW